MKVFLVWLGLIEVVAMRSKTVAVVASVIPCRPLARIVFGKTPTVTRVGKVWLYATD